MESVCYGTVDSAISRQQSVITSHSYALSHLQVMVLAVYDAIGVRDSLKSNILEPCIAPDRKGTIDHNDTFIVCLLPFSCYSNVAA